MRRQTSKGSERMINMIESNEPCPIGKCTFSSREAMMRMCSNKRVIKRMYTKDQIRYVCTKCKVWEDDEFIPEKITIKEMIYDIKN